MAWTTADLLTSIKNRAAVPEDQGNFPDATLLLMADEETQTLLMPAILKYREEWLTYDYDHSITAAQTTYRVPPRAYGGKLRLVKVVDAAGNITHPSKITAERVQEFNGTNSSTVTPTHYWQKHGAIVVEPTPSATSGTLRMTYYRRPSRLVASASLPTVTAINTSTRVVTMTASHGFTTSSVLDIIRAKPEFDALAIDQTPTVVGGSTLMTFAALPTDLAVGDYIVTQQTTPVPQVPAECHPILAQMVANRVLTSLGFLEELKAGEEALKQMLEASAIVLGNRDDGANYKISPRGR